MSEPTPEQIEAAAKAMGEASSGFFSEESWRHLARGALVAAAGVTPQEPEEHFHVWSEVPCQPGRCRLAAPVQVDEAKIAAVLVEHRERVPEWGEGCGCTCGTPLRRATRDLEEETVEEHIASVIAGLLRPAEAAGVPQGAQEVQGALGAVRRLADQWNSTPDQMASDYDMGRVHQRHAMTEQLLEALAVSGGPVPAAPAEVTSGREAVREVLTGDWANAMRKVVEAELTSSSRQAMIRDNPRGWAENTVMAVRAATLRMIR